MNEELDEESYDGGLATIVNEFAAVKLRLVESPTGTRLEISSARLGTSIELDAVALESLTWQQAELFTALVRTPLQPIDAARLDATSDELSSDH